MFSAKPFLQCFDSIQKLIFVFNKDSFTGNNGLHQQYNVEDQLHTANRMAAIANMVGQGGIPPGLGSDPTAANITAANLANLAMRLGVTQVI